MNSGGEGLLYSTWTNTSGIFAPEFVNVVEGGHGLNLIAESCRFFWEARVLPGVNDLALLDGLQAKIRAELVPAMQAVDPACGIRFETMARVPPLSPPPPELERWLLDLLGQTAAEVVAYGSKAGIFQAVGIPSVVFGPGHIAQAHQPDEWIEAAQLEQAVASLEVLVTAFCC